MTHMNVAICGCRRLYREVFVLQWVFFVKKMYGAFAGILECPFGEVGLYQYIKK